MKTHHIKNAFLLTLLWTTFFSAFAEDLFVIKEETYIINGRTREKIIRDQIGSAVGQKFTTYKEVEEFIATRQQKIDNLRLFKKAEVSASPQNTQNDVLQEIVVTTTIEDGSAFVPIPYAFYNSNDGLQIGTVLNAPNVGGTLQNATGVFIYTAPPDEKDRLQFGNPDFMGLISWAGIRAGQWKVNLSGVVFRGEQELQNRGITAVSYRTVSLTGSAGISRSIAGPVSFSTTLRAMGSPSYSVTETIDSEYLRYGPIASSLQVQTGLRFDAFNWIGNFRHGSKGRATIGYTRTNVSSFGLTEDWKAEGEAAAYYALGDRLNPSFRIYGFTSSGLSQLNAGLWTRGIRNNAMKATSGVFLNTGVQIKLFRIKQIELHISPTVDIAYAYARNDPDYESDFGVGAGGEILMLVDAIKSLPIKFGLGYDLRPSKQVPNGKRMEIDFNFSFAY